MRCRGLLPAAGQPFVIMIRIAACAATYPFCFKAPTIKELSTVRIYCPRHFRSLRCSLLPRQSLIKRASSRGVDKVVSEKAFNVAERSLREWTTCVTDFLTPPECTALGVTLGEVADLAVTSWGGYESAERQVIGVTRQDLEKDEGTIRDKINEHLVLLEISGNFLFDKGKGGSAQCKVL